MATNPDQATIQSLCELLSQILEEAQLDDLLSSLGVQRNRSLFTPALVIWLMIFQRLHPTHTLSRAVAELKSGRLNHLFDDCKRSRSGVISGNTGAYSKARERLPKEVAISVADLIFAHCCPDGDERLLWHGYRIFAIDGTTIHLPETPELKTAFPPGGNQLGQATQPVVQLVVAHDLVTGTAVTPTWGAKYGMNNTSEQGLLEVLVPKLPAHSVMVGDRNFGVFSVVYALSQHGNPVVVRLTIDRVRRLLGEDPQDGMRKPMTWTASSHDRRSHPELPPQASVEGSVIVHHLYQEGSQEVIQLYLFTTLELPSDDIIELYDRRWFLEVDLRTLKGMANLQEMTATKVNLVEKEIVLGIAAYNLVRSIITLAAQRLELKPRNISVARVIEAIEANALTLFYENDHEKLLSFLDDFKYYQLYRAKQKPSEPRALKPPKRKFPLLLVPREVARSKLHSKK